MKITQRIFFSLALLLMSYGATAGKFIPAQGQPILGEYIVVFNDNFVGDNNRQQVANTLAQDYDGQVGNVYDVVLNGALVRMSESRAKTLALRKEVLYVEQNQRVHASVTQTPATWGIDRIDQRALPLNNQYIYNFNGTGVHAYILDTGIRSTHTEFGGRVSTQFFDAFNGTGEDCNGHGTHVAATVGGATYGVAKNVTLHKVRVLDCSGSGSNAGVIAGIDWVTLNYIAPAVANMSLGGGPSPSLDAAVNNAVAGGVVFAVAAGNSDLDACGHSPAAAVNALTVASSDSTDARSYFSNWGPCVKVFAPGSDITSAWYTTDAATNTISGTSMASPHVAGVAALLRSEDPTLTAFQVNAKLTSIATANVVVDAKGSPNRLVYSLTTAGPPPPPNPAPVANFVFTTSGLTANFTDTSTSGRIITAWNWSFGDGLTSVARNTPHTYAVAGSYSVSLIVTDNLGATGSITKVVTVSDAPPPCLNDCDGSN